MGWLIIIAVVWYIFAEGSTEAKTWVIIIGSGLALLWYRGLQANVRAQKIIQDYDNRIRAITAPILGERMSEFCENPDKELKLEQVNSMTRKLKLLKREIQLASNEIKTEFSRRGNRAPGSAFGKGLYAGLFGWRISNSVRADSRQRERNRKSNALAPFEELIAKIDSVLLQLDTAILEIEEGEGSK